MSEQPEPNHEPPSRARLPGAPYLSALLIALALLSLVVLARPRGGVDRQSLLPGSGATSTPRVERTPALASTATQIPSPTPTAPHTPTATPATVTVHVAGEVKRPGLYTLPAGSRVGHAVERAGGMTTKADTVAINLAQLLKDEMQVAVPRKGQPAAARPSPTPTDEPTPTPTVPMPPPTPPEAAEGSEPSGADKPAESTGVVNVNTATQAELESLPGIGPTKAAAIIEYREQHGPFTSPEGLLEVKGIGPKTFEAIRDKVRV